MSGSHKIWKLPKAFKIERLDVKIYCMQIWKGKKYVREIQQKIKNPYNILSAFLCLKETNKPPI